MALLWSTVKLVTVLQDVAACRVSWEVIVGSWSLCFLKLQLCGQTPETALNSALASVNFYLKQQMLHFEVKEEQFKKKLHKMQEQCKQKLAEVHTGYKTVNIHIIVIIPVPSHLGKEKISRSSGREKHLRKRHTRTPTEILSESSVSWVWVVWVWVFVG